MRFGPFRLDIGAEAGEDRLVDGREIVTEDRLPRRDGDRPALGHGEDAMAHRAETTFRVGAFPADHRDRQAGEEIGMPRQNAEAASGVLGAQRQHTVLVDHHREGVIMRSLMTAPLR
jgi:hypothetical protein